MHKPLEQRDQEGRLREQSPVSQSCTHKLARAHTHTTRARARTHTHTHVRSAGV
jgi:hypothetical protein